MRSITIVNTQSADQMSTYSSSANTWADLKKDLKKQGMSTEDMSAIIGETDQELKSELETIPEGEFTLFLSPQKVKSGN